MATSMRIRVFARKSKWGLAQDAYLVESTLHLLQLKKDRAAPAWTIEHVDPMTWVPPATEPTADIHIYLEIPVRLATPWAGYNIAVVNPEWWPEHAWDWALQEMDLFVFKSEPAATLYPEVPKEKRVVMPWRTNMLRPLIKPTENRFLYVVGGSANKAAAARDVVRWWQTAWPPLEVHCTAAIAATLEPRASNVSVVTEYLNAAEIQARQAACRWHVAASAAEGFGYTLAEAAVCGAPTLRCDLQSQCWTWRDAFGPAGEITTIIRVPEPIYETEFAREYHVYFTEEALNAAVTSLLALTPADESRIRDDLAARLIKIREEFTHGWEQVWGAYKRHRHPPALPASPVKGAMPPKVGVITVTRNRPDWWPNMVQNITKQAWPISRIEWIIVDDGDAANSLQALVDELAAKVPALSIRYVEMPEVATIGAKRNAAVQAAATDVDVFVCMDDDDHYPVDSIASRVSWLEPTRKGTHIAYCSTLPMYDTRRYISAVNVPPLMESPSERVSEATLAFTRAAHTERPFPDSSMAEGYEFVKGREAKTVELPPQGIIVSFIHGSNTSSRRVPEEQEPNGCHYGFSDAYFSWLSRVSAAAQPVGGSRVSGATTDA
jgi:hypothetical protein